MIQNKPTNCTFSKLLIYILILMFSFYTYTKIFYRLQLTPHYHTSDLRFTLSSYELVLKCHALMSVCQPAPHLQHHSLMDFILVGSDSMDCVLNRSGHTTRHRRSVQFILNQNLLQITLVLLNIVCGDRTTLW
jgi:hypothetical protein